MVHAAICQGHGENGRGESSEHIYLTRHVTAAMMNNPPMIIFGMTSPINRPQQERLDIIPDVANNPLYPEGAQAAEWITDAPVGIDSRMCTDGEKDDSAI